MRVEHADLEEWLKKHLYSTDHVVIESTTNAWHVYDLMAPLVERLVVDNPTTISPTNGLPIRIWWQMDDEARDGLNRQQFTRYYLMRLGIGHDLARIALDPKHPRRIATEAELLALRPELKLTE